MDLKLKDVADLLNVSETTVEDWLNEGKIPSYRLDGQILFSRLEIEDWMLKNKRNRGGVESFDDSVRDSGGSKQFCLYRAIHLGGVCEDVPGDTKEEVIRNTMKRLGKRMDLDADVIADMLLDRERLMPTALNHGIGVPHTRDSLLNRHQDLVAVVFPKKPVDYGALDQQPVHTLFFLFAASDKMHLHLLAKIAHLSSNAEAVKLLRQRPERQELLGFIREWEGKIPAR